MRDRWHPSHLPCARIELPVRINERAGKAARNRCWVELRKSLPGLPARFITDKGAIKS